MYKNRDVSRYVTSDYSFDWTPWAGYPYYGSDSREMYTWDAYNEYNDVVGWYGYRSYFWELHDGPYYYSDNQYSSRDGASSWNNPNCPYPEAYPEYSYVESSTPTSRTTESYGSFSGSYWYGQDSGTSYDYNYESLSNEYTTSELRSNLMSDLDSQWWSIWGSSSSAFYDLSQSETSASAQKMRYRFRFQTIANVSYTVTWNERTYYWSGGTSTIARSATVTGTGGEVTVDGYEIVPPEQNASVYVENETVSYQSPWGPWEIWSPPTVSVNSPGNQCIGVEMSVTANVSDGMKVRYDDCWNADYAPLIPTVEWTVSGVSANPSSGTGAMATFTPTSAGSATVTFYATTTDPDWSGSDSTSFSVVEVLGLAALSGCEIDDGDGSANTRLFVISPWDSSPVTVAATPNPQLSEVDLPGCWSLTGGNGSGKLTRTVNSPGVYSFTCTAGTSSKTTLVAVFDLLELQFKRNDEPDSYYDATGGGDVILNETFRFRARLNISGNDLGAASPALKWRVLNMDSFTVMSSGSGSPFDVTMSSLGSKRAECWVDCNGDGSISPGEPTVSVNFTVLPLRVFFLTFARHIDTPFSNAQADAQCTSGTAILRKRDQLDDVRCGVELRRQGDVAVFGVTGSPPGTPPSIVDSWSDYERVHDVPADFKVVTVISWPGNGLAFTKGLGVASTIMVNAPVPNTVAHEFGHQRGLDHNNSVEHRLMFEDYLLEGQDTLADWERAQYRQ